jgi:hypothetical protein
MYVGRPNRTPASGASSAVLGVRSGERQQALRVGPARPDQRAEPAAARAAHAAAHADLDRRLGAIVAADVEVHPRTDMAGLRLDICRSCHVQAAPAPDACLTGRSIEPRHHTIRHFPPPKDCCSVCLRPASQ